MSNGDSKKKSPKELNREAYGAAMSRLREAHKDEFNSLRQEESTKRGLDWKPKPSEKEKARQQLALLLSDYPELAAEFTAPGDSTVGMG